MLKNVLTLRKRGKIWRMKAHMEGGGFSKVSRSVGFHVEKASSMAISVRWPLPVAASEPYRVTLSPNVFGWFSI